MVCILVQKNVGSASVSLQLLIRNVSESLESVDHLRHFFLASAYGQFLKLSVVQICSPLGNNEFEVSWKVLKPCISTFMKMLLLLYVRILESLFEMFVFSPHFREQIMLRCTGHSVAMSCAL